MKIKLIVSALIVGLLGAGYAQAEVAVTGDLGSTGLGAHISVPIQPNLNARFGLNYLNYSYSSSTTDVDYDYKLKLNTFDALLDYFPMDGGFRVSTGIVYNGNKIDVVGKPTATGTYTLNGNTYTAANAGTINGNIDFRKVAPYLGIGWGNANKEKGWGFSGDLGVLFQGSPNTTLTNSGCTATAALCSQLASDVAVEQVKLADDVSSFKAYPVLRVGISHRF